MAGKKDKLNKLLGVKFFNVNSAVFLKLARLISEQYL